MVLVSYTPYSHISLLQTKFRYREGHETRRIGPEALPLDQHVEGSHGERQARLKIRPAPMHDLFKMANKRQHREDCLDEHTVLPFAALTQFQVGGVAVCGMEARVTQDNHASVDLVNEPLKGVIDVS